MGKAVLCVNQNLTTGCCGQFALKKDMGFPTPEDSFTKQGLSCFENLSDFSFCKPSFPSQLFRIRIISFPNPMPQRIRFNIQRFSEIRFTSVSQRWAAIFRFSSSQPPSRLNDASSYLNVESLANGRYLLLPAR